jgi:hypothetical protein
MAGADPSGHPSFPRRALLAKASDSALEAQGPEFARWEARIVALAGDEVTVSSRSPLAARVQPGDELSVLIEPADPSGFRIQTLGLVRSARRDAGDAQAFTLLLKLEWLEDDQRSLYRSLLECLRTEQK